MRDCRHYQGHRDTLCGAGVNLRGLVGGPDLGWVIRLPCTAVLREANAARSELPCVYCERFDPLTEAETAAAEEETQALIKDSLQRMRLLDPIFATLKQTYRGQDARGILVCPCCQGALHWQHSRHNGHVWVRCATPDCVAIME
jgi:hypothetical protein